MILYTGVRHGERERNYRPGGKNGQKPTRNSAHNLMDPELQEVLEFLEINPKVENYLEDPYITNYFEFESGNEKPVIRGRLKSAVRYWSEVIKAPASVLNIISSGVKLDFVTPPPRMCSPNNNSAKKYSEFVDEAVKELLEYDLIKEVTEIPHVVSPLSVALNGDKKRLILDLSNLNEFIVYERFKLEDHSTFFEMSKLCNFLGSFDIKSCFHQLEMDPEFVKFLGFSWNFNGHKKYFIFLVVPFGLSSAPRICKMVFRPLIQKWRAELITVCLFFDDGIFGGSTFSECKKVSKTIFTDLMNCHILPNPSKCFWEPCQKITWLGFDWDVKNGIVSVSKQRADRLFSRLREFENSAPIVTARKTAKVVGSVISMLLVLGENCLLFTRFLQNLINFRNWEEISWDAKINLSALDFGFKTLEEIKYLKDNFETLNVRKLEPLTLQHKCIFGDAGVCCIL